MTESKRNYHAMQKIKVSYESCKNYFCKLSKLNKSNTKQIKNYFYILKYLYCKKLYVSQYAFFYHNENDRKLLLFFFYIHL